MRTIPAFSRHDIHAAADRLRIHGVKWRDIQLMMLADQMLASPRDAKRIMADLIRLGRTVTWDMLQDRPVETTALNFEAFCFARSVQTFGGTPVFTTLYPDYQA